MYLISFSFPIAPHHVLKNTHINLYFTMFGEMTTCGCFLWTLLFYLFSLFLFLWCTHCFTEIPWWSSPLMAKLGIRLRRLCIPGKFSTVELYLHSLYNLRIEFYAYSISVPQNFCGCCRHFVIFLSIIETTLSLSTSLVDWLDFITWNIFLCIYTFWKNEALVISTFWQEEHRKILYLPKCFF